MVLWLFQGDEIACSQKKNDEIARATLPPFNQISDCRSHLVNIGP